MVKFETIKSDEVKFGTNNFLEVAQKKAITDDGENTFISVSRGFIDMNGNRRYRKSIAIPMSKDVIDFVVESVKEMGSGAAHAKSAPKKKAMKEDDAEDSEETENMEEMDEETEE